MKKPLHIRVLREIKFWWQRRSRGWDDSETWSLAEPIARFIAPRLRRFKDISYIPPYSISVDQWTKDLDLMIFTFETIAADEDGSREWQNNPVVSMKVKYGLKLFAKRYLDLWWYPYE